MLSGFYLADKFITQNIIAGVGIAFLTGGFTTFFSYAILGYK
jgi:ABC-type uncharacterized transport system permease subunit